MHTDALPLLVIVTGLPCTGKTVLARKIAAQTTLPLVEKDAIKERLFDSLGWSNREWSKNLGLATFDLLFYFIELQLCAGRSLIAEARFFPQFHLARLEEIRQRCPFRPFVVELSADGDILLRRFIERSESGERHPGHVDHTNYAEAQVVFSGEIPAPFDLSGRYIRVDSSDFARLDDNALIAMIRADMQPVV